MFNEKGFISFKRDDYKTTIHYIKEGDKLVGLTEKSSNKIGVFNENNQIEAGEGPKATEFTNVTVNVVMDDAEAKRIYDKMNEIEFNHFKEFNDEICVIEIV